MLSRVFWALILVSSGAANLFGDTIMVPDDYATIQDAINYAQSGDTVLVSPGSYAENVDFNGKDLVVGSLFLVTEDRGFISQTIIDGDTAHTVTFANGEETGAVLCGFTITGASGIENRTGFRGGILISGSSPTVQNNMIRGNLAEQTGGGILIEGGSPTIRDNIITQNAAGACGGSGGGIAVKDSANPLIIRNTITENRVEGFCDCVCYFGGGIWVDSSSNPVIGGSEPAANNINSNFADVGFLLYREGSGNIIDAQFNYWGSCPPNWGDVFPESEFDVSNCLDTPAAVDDGKETFYVPRDYKLFQNYPNPFNSSSMISYSIPKPDFVSLKIHDLRGREIKTMVSEFQGAGTYFVHFETRQLASGVYFYTLQAGKAYRETKKMVLSK